jgi:hypothetical protein
MHTKYSIQINVFDADAIAFVQIALYCELDCNGGGSCFETKQRNLCPVIGGRMNDVNITVPVNDTININIVQLRT